MGAPSASATAQKRGLFDMLPAQVTQGGPPWLTARRQSALARLREAGFPARKAEGWQFTPVHKVTAIPFVPAPEAAKLDEARQAAILAAEHGGGDAAAALLVNGQPVLSGGGLPDGVRAMPLSQAVVEVPGLKVQLGKLAPAQHFAALNLALFEDGLWLDIAADADIREPIEIVHLAASASAPNLVCPRVVITAGANSRAAVVETYLSDGGEHLAVPVTEVALGENAALEHERITLGKKAGYHIASLAVTQARDSRYRSRVVTCGGPLSRLDIRVTLDGQGAECELFGFYHATGSDHVDHWTWINHAASHAQSREVYRGIADGRGSAVFDGTIIVARGAVKTSAHQENRNLLLSDDASVNTKPHLEIDADDVSCSHGATIGALDTAALSYLRARGIGERDARSILTAAFVREILDHVSDGGVRQRLADALAPRLDLGDTAAALLQSSDDDWDALAR